MGFFENCDPKELLLFVQNFQMNLEASGMLAASAKIQYLATLLCGKFLHQLDIFSVEVVSTITTHLNRVVLVLGTYYFPVNVLSNQKRAMRRRMRNSRELKVIWYAAHMFKINEYLDTFPGAKANEKLVRRNWIKFFWIVCQMAGASKRTCRVFIVNQLLFKGYKYVSMHVHFGIYLWRCCRTFL